MPANRIKTKSATNRRRAGGHSRCVPLKRVMRSRRPSSGELQLDRFPRPNEARDTRNRECFNLRLFMDWRSRKRNGLQTHPTLLRVIRPVTYDECRNTMNTHMIAPKPTASAKIFRFNSVKEIFLPDSNHQCRKSCFRIVEDFSAHCSHCCAQRRRSNPFQTLRFGRLTERII